MNKNNRHIGTGITFCEVSPGDMFHLDAASAYHLIFLLKGDLEVKSRGDTLCVAENEFFVIDHNRQADWAVTEPSRLVVVDCNADGDDVCSLPRGEKGLICSYTIHRELSTLLNYLMATMPSNEKLEHHSIQRVIKVMMRKYYTQVNSL